MNLPEIAHNLSGLSHDVNTCGFSSYGIKESTYFDWRRRLELLSKQLESYVERQVAEPEPEPALPPPPLPRG